jgi:hypothetical protein
MTSIGRYGRSGLLILAAGVGLAFAAPAGAQIWPRDMKTDPPAGQAAPDVDASEDDTDTSAADSAVNKDSDIKGLELDWSQLNVDASTLTWTPASKARAANPKPALGTDTSWSSSDKANGSAAVSVKQSLSPFLDTRVGADMTVTRPPQTLTEQQLLSEKLANGGSLPQSSGTAWAAITAPGAGSIWDKTAVEARLDPSQEQTRLGTSLSKSLPLTAHYALTLQNGYNLVEQGIIPVPGIIGRPVRNYETDQSAKLSIADTGTSFTAGQSLSSTDDRWLRKVGAEQNLFGGVSISGSIGETSLGTTNRSFSAAYKQSW